ncbi:hypothetical protein [Arthrobacter glacialis]|uniref:Dehydrogenase n=1 Tax=Arthrobacter glacialis TaxID=1664 RepID=A0A2S4A1Y7_ARTGL|nr:hypothetical protein [Arthrobacter glacialis]POH61266.1 hypothetical protein CVS28_01920 [Arthrobacter glacialis]POH75414.1 hypothetical protein CVS27_02165 [Arthrobacter glacialis]
MLKGLFSVNRQAKRDDADLGKGVWRRAHDRFRRGLDRFHQMLEGLAEAVPDASASTEVARQSAQNYEAMVQLANSLAELLPEVRSIATQAQTVGPSEGMEIPAGSGGYLNDVHRELSRAGNALAATAEALALLRLGMGEPSGVERKAVIVRQHVSRAQELLARKQSGG